MTTRSAGPARYREIEQWLHERCQQLGPGALLPSEAELAEQFSVSRMTARQAVQNLAQAGLVLRKRGAGTFVAPQPLHREEAILYSFTEDMRRRGMAPSSRLLSANLAASPDDAAMMGLPTGEWLVKIDRVRYANEIPLAREKVVLPGEFAGVLEHDLEAGSLHAALAAMGRVMGRATGFVTARLAGQDERELLDLADPSPLLVESRTISDVEGKIVERTETAYVAARWVIDTGSYVPPDASAAPIAPAQGPRAAGST
ncbi:MAG: GntR family transcriptional regulator [Propionibacteriaceae bacterium]